MRQVWLPLTFLAVSCAHAPRLEEGSRSIWQSDRAAAMASLEALPLCLPAELSEAQPVSALLEGEAKAGTAIRAKGILRPTLNGCTLMECRSAEQPSYSAAEILAYLEPQCCNRCSQVLRLTDPAQPARGVVIKRAQPLPSVHECSEPIIQDEYARVPVVLEGKLAAPPASEGAWLVEVDTLCRGAIERRPRPAPATPAPGGKTSSLLQGLLRAADVYSGQPLGLRALKAAIRVALAHEDEDQARLIGRRLTAEYRDPAWQVDLLAKEAAGALKQGRWAAAAGTFHEAGAVPPGEPSLLITASSLKLALGDGEGAIKSLELALAKGGPRRAEVLTLIAQAQLKQNQLESARATAQQALELVPANAQAAAIVAEVMARTPNEKTQPLITLLQAVAMAPVRDEAALAGALWHLGELQYRELKATPAADKAARLALLEKLEELHGRIAQLGSPEWQVASGWRLGNSLQRVAETGDETAGERAKAQFEACLQLAERAQVFTPAVLGCRQQVDQVSSPFPPARAARPEALNVKTENAADFEDLGLRHLANFELHLARLELTHATELEDGWPSSFTALGYALLLAGDAMGARRAYGRALEIDPRYLKARANLAALRCRFGDAEGARAELAAIKDTGSLAGPEVDPEWGRCR